MFSYNCERICRSYSVQSANRQYIFIRRIIQSKHKNYLTYFDHDIITCAIDAANILISNHLNDFLQYVPNTVYTLKQKKERRGQFCLLFYFVTVNMSFSLFIDNIYDRRLMAMRHTIYQYTRMYIQTLANGVKYARTHGRSLSDAMNYKMFTSFLIMLFGLN